MTQPLPTPPPVVVPRVLWRSERFAPAAEQFKHLMQPFEVSLAPGGIEVHRQTTPSTPTSGSTSSSTSISTSSPISSFLVTVTLSIANRYDHTDRLQEPLTFGWEVEVDGLVVAAGDDLLPVTAGSSGNDANRGGSNQGHEIGRAGVTTLAGVGSGTREAGDLGDERVWMAKVAFEAPSLLVDGQECWLTVTGRLREDAPWAAAGHVVGRAQLELRAGEVRTGILGRGGGGGGVVMCFLHVVFR